jgi:hypothetical protein
MERVTKTFGECKPLVKTTTLNDEAEKVIRHGKLVVSNYVLRSSAVNIPKCGWNEPVFVMVNGVLRQTYFKRADIFLCNLNNCGNAFETRFVRYTLDVAGCGIMYFVGDWKDMGFTTYASVDDFNNGLVINDNNSYTLANMLYAVSGGGLYTKVDSRVCGCMGFVQYTMKKDKHEVKEIYARVPSVITYTKESGFSLYKPWLLDEGIYPTAEECKADNEVEVVTFDGDRKKKEKTLHKVEVCGCVYVGDDEIMRELINVLDDFFGKE